MTTAQQTRRLPFSKEQMFDLVEDVASYPQFIPWCVAARIRKREPGYQLADPMIGFKMIREKFTSHVRSDREAMVIKSEAAQGPFKHLVNVWQFEDDSEAGPGHCLVKLNIDFEFSNKVLQRVIETVFEEAQKRMVGAFEQRAYALYGSSDSNSSRSPSEA